jgi:hypothetical protein
MKKWIINQKIFKSNNTKALPQPEEKNATQAPGSNAEKRRMSTFEALVVSYYNLAMNDFGTGAIAGSSFSRF